jgi:hypothetical protein
MNSLKFIRRIALPSLAVGLVLAIHATAAENDLEKEFRSIQRSVQTQLKSKSREQRLAAVKKLEGFPVLEAAKLLHLSGMASGDEEVRRASYEVLLKFKEDQGIGSYLAQAVEKDLKRSAVDEGTCGAMGVLLASENADLAKKTQQLLELAAGTRGTSGLLLLVTMADELGAQGTPASFGSLQKLAKLPLFEKHFAFRRAVTQGLMRVRQVDAVTALVDLLPKAQGEVRADILKYLTTISGQQLGGDAMQWATWWKTNKAGFKFPPAEKPLALVRANIAPPAGGSYYGLPLANKVVFVMDTSLSMRGARIDAAKRELIKAISELPETTEFAVLVFNARATPWLDRLVPATSENREAACRFVFAQELGNNTASYDALEAALTFEAEAIYFLTDGAPYGGKVTQPVQIVTLITKLNRLRRMTINSIGIGVGADGNVFDTFLKAISAANYGQYIRVDE